MCCLTRDLDGNRLKNMSTVVAFSTASPALTELRLASNNITNCSLSSTQSSLEILYVCERCVALHHYVQHQ